MDEKRRPNKRGADNESKNIPANDNDGSTVSNTPRKRVSQACDRCRSRKDKCDGGKPRCSTCASLDQVCSYDPATKKRGLPEGYVRGLEKLWGLAIREADGIEDTVLSLLNCGPDDDALLKAWNDREGLETLQETWRKSRISHELDRLLPFLESSDEKSVKRRRVGIDSTNTPNADYKIPFHGISSSDYGQSSNFTITKDPGDYLPNEIPKIEACVTSISKSTISDQQIGIPQRSWHLLDVYFSYTHCWLPIVEKHDVLRISYQYPMTFSEVSCILPGSGNHAALWAILSYAEHQNNATKKALRPPQDDWNVKSLYSKARSLIPLEDGVFELGHVQALLILTLLNMGTNQWDRAWLLVGQAVRIAVNLGLDEGVRDSNSADKRTRSTHVFLGCFVLDTIIAAHLGRVPQLSNDDVKRAGSVVEDGSDEWNPWTDTLGLRREKMDGPRGPVAVLSTFNRLIKLIEILNMISRDVTVGVRRDELCQALMNKLSTWGNALPSQFSPNTLSQDQDSPSLLPHQYHLHLAHIGIISALYAHISASADAVQVSEQTLSDTFSMAARQAMWLLMRHSETFGLLIVPPTFDYFVSSTCDKVQSDVTDKHISHSDWERNMQHYLGVMAKAWPTFEARKSLVAAKPVSVSDSLFGSPTAADILITENDPSGYRNQPSTSEDALTFREGDSTAKATPVSQYNSAITPVQYDRLLELSTTARLQSLTENTSRWASPQIASNQFVVPTPSEYLDFAHHGSVSSDLEGDSMFNEFATLDALEWGNNWDQSLLNLGFTDPENMHSDFYAFAREPDPIYSTNLVQQLLSDNNENTNLGPMVGGSGVLTGLHSGVMAQFDGQSGAGAGSFLHVRGDKSFSNPHVEASQILQALSGAGERTGEGG